MTCIDAEVIVISSSVINAIAAEIEKTSFLFILYPHKRFSKQIDSITTTY